MSWEPDNSTGGAGGDTTWLDAPTFQPEGAGDNGDYVGQNVSRHANDGGCRICHADGHFARDCPDKDNAEREFTGECRVCGQVGHRAAQCPNRGPQMCRICNEEGHIAAECSTNRLFVGLDNVNAEEAWQNLLAADATKDTDVIKEAILKYAKSTPDLTFPEIEEALRDINRNTHLIAMQKEILVSLTSMNLQGKPGQKYVVSIQFTPQPRRAKFAAAWPKTADENTERLSDAGFLVPSLAVMCYRCGDAGHTTRACEQAPLERAPVLCAICGNAGHRTRECTEERKTGRKPLLCRNCDQEGHKASDCTEPPKCRNCDEIGHNSKECPKPTDWSRVECRTCHEKGHSAKRCPQGPPPDGENVKPADGFGENDSGKFDAAPAGNPVDDSGYADAWGADTGASAAVGGW